MSARTERDDRPADAPAGRGGGGGRTPVNDRIAARRAAVVSARRRRFLRRATVLAVVVAVVAGALALERSSLVAVASLEVTGVERLDPAAVRAASGVELGTSVLRVRLDEVERRIESLPLVDAVAVGRDGPLGLVIDVEEVAPAVTVRYADGAVLLDRSGLVLGTGTARGTPTVRLPGEAPPPGTRVASDPVLAAAHAVVLGLPGPLGSLVDVVRATAPDDVRLVLDSGTVVRWGDEGRADEKARALGAVLEDLDDRVVAAIDVRAPSAPTVVP